MSKAELKTWLVWLGITGIGAVLAFILPVSGLIILLYMFIGVLVMFCPAAFMYLLSAFALSGLMSLVVPKWAWLRLAVSVAAVAGAAQLVSGQLNKPYDQAFARVVADDVRLAARPAFSRVVLVDDRGDGRPVTTAEQDDRSPCRPDGCITYLTNGQAQAVLLPADPSDRRPVTQRVYRIFSQRPDCIPPKDSRDLFDRIWDGDCLAKEEAGPVAPGDMIVHAFDVTVPYATRDCRCQRVEVFVMTADGPELIERETMFDMLRYGDIPVPMRDAGWTGSYFDHGWTWMTRKGHGRDYETVRKDDLGLSPDFVWKGRPLLHRG